MSSRETGSTAVGRDRWGAILPRRAISAPAREPVGVVGAAYGQRDFRMRRLLLAADLTGIGLALLAASQAASRPSLAAFLLVGLLTLPMWIVVFQMYGLYHRDIRRVSHTSVDDIPWLFHALLVGSLLMWVVYKLALPLDQLVLPELITFAAVAMAGVLLLRTLTRLVVKRRLGREKTLLIGDDAVIAPLIRKIAAHPEYGLEPVGRLHVSREATPNGSLPVLGTLAELQDAAAHHGVERVIISHTGLDEEEILDLLRLAKRLGLKVSLLPQMFDVMGPSVEIDDVEGVTLFAINPPVLSRSSRALKRGMDLAGALLLVVLFAPLLATIAISIVLDSRGPILYRQQRVGRGGKRFNVLKFRSMVLGADTRVAELMGESQDENWLKLERDPRITRVGRLLRYTSLDELPQMWNVLRGDMSLVGPRPLVESEDNLIGGWGRSRLDLMPGITGSWQVLGRTNIPFDEMVKLDYLYVTNWSLWRDIRLMLKTLPAVLARRGAN